MKFSIGDIVLLKQTGEEGVVTNLMSKEMVEVSVNGVHFPAYIDELDHPYLKWFTEKRRNTKKTISPQDNIPPKEQENTMLKVATGFHLAFLPVYRFEEFDDIVDKFKTYFINQTQFALSLQYECIGLQGRLFQHTAQIQPFTNFYLHDISFDEMQDQPRFSWILEQQVDTAKSAKLSDTLRMKRKKLFNYLNKTQLQNEPMFNVALAQDFPKANDFPKEPLPDVDLPSILGGLSENLVKRRTPKAISEIDLHIEQLVSDSFGLSSFEMLNIQLEALSTALDTAIAAGQHSMIIIHGVGSGRLKEEIHQVLEATSSVDYFKNDWSPNYGYGATQVFFDTYR